MIYEDSPVFKYGGVVSETHWRCNRKTGHI